jgi:hypothetical protein
MPQNERARVLNGDLQKTSGGLTAKDLVRNKRGKVVSRKKSSQAQGNDNNLGSWLRSKGDTFQGKPKAFKEDEKDDEKLAEVPVKAKPKKKSAAPKKAAPKPKKAAPKPKKAAPKPKKSAAPVIDLTDSPVKAAKPKQQKKKKLEPMVPGEEKDLSKISVGNIRTKEEGQKASDANAIKQMKKMGFTDKDIAEILSGGGLSNAAKVRRMLKATKRKGKRRTKKQLLQDVIDLA